MKHLYIILLCLPLIGFGQIKNYSSEHFSFSYPNSYITKKVADKLNELFKDETTHKKAIFSLRFSPDETVFASCSIDESVRFWNSKTFKTQ